MRRATIAAAVAVGIATAAAFAQPGGTQYIATSWAGNSIEYLDSSFTPIGSFPFGANAPNGIATDGSTIWAGTFGPNTVFAYDMAGNPLYSWVDPNNGNLQGMEFVAGDLAVQDGGLILYYDALTGVVNGSIPSPGGSVEGLAYDSPNALLFALETSQIYALDPFTGAVQYTIPNAAVGDPFGGTGITYLGGNQLALGSANGNWYIVDSLTGGVITSGNNGLDMFGLKVIPAPGALGVMAGALGLIALRRRR